MDRNNPKELYAFLFPTNNLSFRILFQNDRPEHIPVQDYDEISAILEQYDGEAVYVTLNDHNPTKRFPSNEDITHSRYVLLDFDFKQKLSPDEYQEELERLYYIVEQLHQMGIHGHLMASGRGMHYYIMVDHTYTDKSDRDQCKDVFRSLLVFIEKQIGSECGENIKIDIVTHDLGRIVRAPLSMNNKAKPRIRCQYIDTFEGEPLTVPKIKQMIGYTGTTTANVSNEEADDDVLNSLRDYMELRGDALRVYDSRDAKGMKILDKWLVEYCPFSKTKEETHKGDACIYLHANGTLRYHCFHDSCKGEEGKEHTFDEYLDTTEVNYNPNSIPLNGRYTRTEKENESWKNTKTDNAVVIKSSFHVHPNFPNQTVAGVDYLYNRETGVLEFTDNGVNYSVRMDLLLIPEEDLCSEQAIVEMIKRDKGFPQPLAFYTELFLTDENMLRCYGEALVHSNKTRLTDDGVYFPEPTGVWKKNSGSTKSVLDSTFTGEFVNMMSRRLSDLSSYLKKILKSDEFSNKDLGELLLNSVASAKKTLRKKYGDKNHPNITKEVSTIVGRISESRPIPPNRPTEMVDDGTYYTQAAIENELDYTNTEGQPLYQEVYGDLTRVYRRKYANQYIAYKNGVLCLNSLKILPHDANRFVVDYVDVEYTYGSSTEKQREVFQDALDCWFSPEDQKLIQRRLGSYLNPSEKCIHAWNRLLLLVGEGGTGKTAFETLMAKMFHSENNVLSPATLKKNNPELEKRLGAMGKYRLMTIQELDVVPSEIDITNFKTLFDGYAMQTRANYQDAKTTFLDVGFLATSNSMPKFNEFNERDMAAIKRRLTVVQMKQKKTLSKQTTRIHDILYRDAYHAIMDWLIDGCKLARQSKEQDQILEASDEDWEKVRQTIEEFLVPEKGSELVLEDIVDFVISKSPSFFKENISEKFSSRIGSIWLNGGRKWENNTLYDFTLPLEVFGLSEKQQLDKAHEILQKHLRRDDVGSVKLNDIVALVERKTCMVDGEVLTRLIHYRMTREWNRDEKSKFYECRWDDTVLYGFSPNQPRPDDIWDLYYSVLQRHIVRCAGGTLKKTELVNIILEQYPDADRSDIHHKVGYKIGQVWSLKKESVFYGAKFDNHKLLNCRVVWEDLRQDMWDEVYRILSANLRPKLNKKISNLTLCRFVMKNNPNLDMDILESALRYKIQNHWSKEEGNVFFGAKWEDNSLCDFALTLPRRVNTTNSEPSQEN